MRKKSLALFLERNPQMARTIDIRHLRYCRDSSTGEKPWINLFLKKREIEAIFKKLFFSSSKEELVHYLKNDFTLREADLVQV